MSTNKFSTYLPQLTQPLPHAGTKGSIRAHFLGRMQRLSGWLAGWRQKESHLNPEVDYELENDLFNENGCFHISEGQARLERMIDLNWVNLRMKKTL